MSHPTLISIVISEVTLIFPLPLFLQPSNVVFEYYAAPFERCSTNGRRIASLNFHNFFIC